MQTLSVVVDHVGVGGEPDTVRLVDREAAATGVPGGTSAAGFAALELRDEVTLVVDGGDPGRLVELAVPAPRRQQAAALVTRLLGEAAARAAAEAIARDQPARTVVVSA